MTRNKLINTFKILREKNPRFFQSIYYHLRIKGNRKFPNLFIICNKARLSIHKTAKINVLNGEFIFNCGWLRRDPHPSVLIMKRNAELTIEGKLFLHSDAKISINENGKVTIGKAFINSGLNLCCCEEIRIGNDVVISENAFIRDNDGHEITGRTTPSTQKIRIEDKVWIGANVTILKGVSVGTGSIIAAGAVVVNDIPPGCLAGGVPAKVIKSNVTWE